MIAPSRRIAVWRLKIKFPSEQELKSSKSSFSLEKG